VCPGRRGVPENRPTTAKQGIGPRWTSIATGVRNRNERRPSIPPPPRSIKSLQRRLGVFRRSRFGFSFNRLRVFPENEAGSDFGRPVV
jgi:hypothetical protein